MHPEPEGSQAFQQKCLYDKSMATSHYYKDVRSCVQEHINLYGITAIVAEYEVTMVIFYANFGLNQTRRILNA